MSKLERILALLLVITLALLFTTVYLQRESARPAGETELQRQQAEQQRETAEANY